MAWIETISPENARGRLKQEFDLAIRRSGRVWNIVGIMSLNPRVLKNSMALYKEIMFGPSDLSRQQRELIATVVSRSNDCFY
jgi:alkylhydroperoxidase family enzyme